MTCDTLNGGTQLSRIQPGPVGLDSFIECVFVYWRNIGQSRGGVVATRSGQRGLGTHSDAHQRGGGGREGKCQDDRPILEANVVK